MTLEELNQWMKESVRLNGGEDYDYESGCSYAWEIYENNGKLYRVDFCNGHPCSKWGEKGLILGEFEPIEVTRHVEIVEKVDYIPVNP